MDEHSQGEFWELIERHRDTLWRFTLGLARSREDALDLMSDTVLAAYQAFDRLRDRQAFLKMLYTIAYRTHKRKLWRKRIFSGEEASATMEQGYVPAGESAHDLELLLEALASLPEKQRQAILLFEISGFSLEEIREMQGGTLSGVKSRLKRARTALQVLMRDEPQWSARYRSSTRMATPSQSLKYQRL